MHQAYSCAITVVDALLSPTNTDSVETLHYCSGETAQAYQLPQWVTFEWAIRAPSERLTSLLQTTHPHLIPSRDVIQTRPIRLLSFTTLMHEYRIRTVGRFVLDEFSTPVLVSAAKEYWKVHPSAAPIIIEIRPSPSSPATSIIDQVNRHLPARFRYQTHHYEENVIYQFRRDATAYLCTDLCFVDKRTHKSIRHVLTAYGIECHVFPIYPHHHHGPSMMNHQTIVEAVQKVETNAILIGNTSVGMLPWKRQRTPMEDENEVGKSSNSRYKDDLMMVHLAARCLITVQFARVGDSEEVYGTIMEKMWPGFDRHARYVGVAENGCRLLEEKLYGGTRNVPWTPFGVSEAFIQMVRLHPVVFKGHQRPSDHRYVMTVGVRVHEFQTNWVKSIKQVLRSKMSLANVCFDFVNYDLYQHHPDHSPSCTDIIQSLRPIDLWISLSKTDAGFATEFECAAMGIPILVRHGGGNASCIQGVKTYTSNYQLAGLMEELVLDSDAYLRYATAMKQQVCEHWCTEKLVREHMLPVVMDLLSVAN